MSFINNTSFALFYRVLSFLSCNEIRKYYIIICHVCYIINFIFKNRQFWSWPEQYYILTDQLTFKLTVFFQIRLIFRANNSNASRALDENASLGEKQRIENKISTNEGLSALFHSRCWLTRHKTEIGNFDSTRITVREFLVGRRETVIFALSSDRINDLARDTDAVSSFCPIREIIRHIEIPQMTGRARYAEIAMHVIFPLNAYISTHTHYGRESVISRVVLWIRLNICQSCNRITNQWIHEDTCIRFAKENFVSPFPIASIYSSVRFCLIFCTNITRY